jgi:hypothetical protein
MNLTLTAYLGDNCIVFENFTTSIGGLMVVNRVIIKEMFYIPIKLKPELAVPP